MVSGSPHPPLAPAAFGLAALALLALGACNPARERAGGAIPPSRFALHAVPATGAPGTTDARRAACVDIRFQHAGPPGVWWRCPTEVRMAVRVDGGGTDAGIASDEVTARGAAARAADTAAREVMARGTPESADAACKQFHDRMQALLRAERPDAAVTPFDACTRHRLPTTYFP